jgi:hypothetical protein
MLRQQPRPADADLPLSENPVVADDGYILIDMPRQSENPANKQNRRAPPHCNKQCPHGCASLWLSAP